MSDSEKQSDSFLSKIIAPILIALFVGGTAPWWWSEFIAEKSGNGSTFPSGVNSSNTQDSEQDGTNRMNWESSQRNNGQQDSEQEIIDRINRESRQRNDERDKYKPISMQEIASRTFTVGTDRRAIAFDAFGLTSFEEGSSPSDLFIDEYTEYSAITVTSFHGGDDSVAGGRYRIEFEKIDQERWQVVWAGKQWKCVRSDSKEWTVQLCP